VGPAWRPAVGAETFCAICTYLATVTRHGINWPGALTQAAQGKPWIPGTT
jgi:transposase